LVIVVSIVFGAAAAIVTTLLPKSYEANTSLLIGISTTGSDPGYQDLLASQLLAQTYAELASTRPIMLAVIEDLGLDQTPQQLAESLRVEASGVNPIVHVWVRGPDPDQVADVANAIARNLTEWVPEDPSGNVDALPELQGTLARIDAQIAVAQGEVDQLQEQGPEAAPGALQASLARLASLLSTRASLLQLMAGTSSNTVTVIEPAARPTEPAGSGIALNVAAASLLGALLAAGALFAAFEVRSSSGQTSAEA
jgi:uncharacterized protein involved in exopolysaccharide biosynthesis